MGMMFRIIGFSVCSGSVRTSAHVIVCYHDYFERGDPETWSGEPREASIGQV